ncbi:hypothetical protein D0Y65_020440 [Glycine soja]|uniref:Uncharacterized protein n=1 Tax=Glycine soja TaxID=3848 RepID=A0A445JE33_GLYSO|nr:hypothetical protein D0Y65_020440 [Glycine soja]
MFSNPQLFPQVDDPLLRITPSKLTERRSGTGVRGHMELHPPVRRAAIAAYHAVETRMHSLTPHGRELLSDNMIEDNAPLGAGGTRVELWLPSSIVQSDLSSHVQEV